MLAELDRSIPRTALLIAIAMAAVGLGTSIKGLRAIGLKPLAVGLFSAVLVGIVSFTLISVLY